MKPYPFTTVPGHEFHRTDRDFRHGETPAWGWQRALQGFASVSLPVSYLHLHWAGYPKLTQRFVTAVHARAASLACGRA